MEQFHSACCANPSGGGATRAAHPGSRIHELLIRAVLAGALIILAGCATTSIQRASQIGTLGKAYADAVSAAGNEAMASATTFSLAEIRNERSGGAFRTPTERQAAIDGQIDSLKRRQVLVAESDEQVALLGEYFTTLEQFANQDVATAVETATGSLTASINKLGIAIENNPDAKAKLSDPQVAAIAKLSGLVARQIHGQVLARILERDAGMIGRQLALLAKVLATYAEWIGTRSDMELKDFYRQKVTGPFVATGDLPAGWDDDVRIYLHGSNLAAQLVKAQAAGERMERFWAGYLAGNTSITEMVADLKEVQSLLDAISDLRKAKKTGS